MATYDLTQGIPGSIAIGDILNVPYSGSPISMTLPAGRYKLETWGAEGSQVYPMGTPGRGGYSMGILSLYTSKLCYFLAGGTNGYNGGGSNSENYYVPTFSNASSGGGSDVRIGTNTYYYRVIVAGGGGCGGAVQDGNTIYPVSGGYGGGTNGGNSAAVNNKTSTGGTQTAGGTSAMPNPNNAGGFGEGGITSGGGGWYSGGGTNLTAATAVKWGTAFPCGGGSGFVYTEENAGKVPSGYGLNSTYYLESDSAVTKTGASSILLPDGTSSVGNTGNGYVRITVLTPRLKTPTVTSVSEPTEGTVQIAFSTVSGATAYKVTNGSGTVLDTLTASPYTQTGITPNTVYTWKIIATGSGYLDSAPATVNYNSKLKLATPTNLRATYTVSATTVLWNAVSGAQNYSVKRNGTQIATVSSPQYTDNAANAGKSFTYTITAKASGRWDSNEATINTSNKPQLANVTNLAAAQTVSSVTLTWTPAANATKYDIYRDGTKKGSATGNSFVDGTTEAGHGYQYKVVSTASGYYDSTGANIYVGVRERLATPDLVEANQTQTSVTLNWTERDYGVQITFYLYRGSTLVYQGHSKNFTDTGLTPRTKYVYSLIAAIPGSGYYDSLPALLEVMPGRDYTTTERQQDYLKSLTRPFTKLCRLRFLNPNGTTAFALDNNPKNKRSRTFIASGTVTANLQNGQRYTATVTLDNVNGDYETAVNKIWFGQEIALDEGLILSNGEEYYRQTGVFVIDNPQEKMNPNNRTVTYNLIDKWAKLDGKLGGNLEGTYEVPVGTNIFNPIAALLAEDIGNGTPVDNQPAVYTEYYNDKTQALPDGTTASMIESPYTLTVNGDGGTIAAVFLGLAGMVNAWIGYDSTGRLRIDPSQDDILDDTKPVLWRFTPENSQLLGATYTVKKDELYNDIIIVGEQLDDYSQPAGRATNADPRSDTNVGLIGLRTKRESASGYSTVQQCLDLAEWKLKRSSVLQKAVSISCSQMMHIDLNSLVEVVRTDKPGSPVERHLIQGFTRPLAYSGAMTISATSVNDYPTATVTPVS